MKPQRVLLGTQCGGGLGHVYKLLAIARALRERGVEPLLVVNNLAEASARLAAEDIRALQAPITAPRRIAPEDRSDSYYDVLRLCGFGRANELFVELKWWDDLLSLSAPNLVVADYAPTLCLAASGRVPVVTIGTGFTVPPLHGEFFPSLTNRSPALEGQAAMLETVREVQKRRSRPVHEHLPAVVRGVQNFACTVSLLDPYRAYRDGPVDGPLLVERPRPTARRMHYFAYLAGDAPKLETALRGISASGLRGRIYLRHPSEQMLGLASSLSLTCTDAPVDLPTVLGETGILVHHGGLSTSQQALLAATPQVLLPRCFEQELTARALVETGGAALVAGDVTPDDLGACLTAVATRPSYLAAAEAAAKALDHRETAGCLGAIVDVCLQALV